MSDEKDPKPIAEDLPSLIAQITERAEKAGHFDRVEQAAVQERSTDAVARRDRELSALESRGIPTRYAGRVVDGDPLPTKALACAQSFALDRKTLLVLSGPPGCGKTFAAAWLVANSEKSSLFFHISQLLRVSPYSSSDMRPIETAALLVLDDVGSEYADKNGMLLFVLDSLIEVRSSHLRKTVLTTNIPLADFMQRYSGRITDRVRDGAFVEFNQQSLRGLN
jgi:DNA replication protein DnaC